MCVQDVMLELQNELQSVPADSSEPKAKNEDDIVNEVLGKRSKYLKCWGQLPKNYTDDSSHKASVASSSTDVLETLHKQQSIIDKQQSIIDKQQNTIDKQQNTMDEFREKIERLEKNTQQPPNNRDQPESSPTN